MLVTGLLVMCMPVFSRADTGERDDPNPPERPEIGCGSRPGAALPSEGAVAWQLQLLLDFQLLASSAR